MPLTARLLACAALAATIAAGPSSAQESVADAGTHSPAPDAGQADGAASLDALLRQFAAGAGKPAGSVRLDAWVEAGDDGRKELVVVVEPEGETKLVADPGITVTPAARRGVDWQLPLPYRLVDAGRDYFDPPAMARLPFVSADDRPIRLLVEYAYCVVDYQCFFGEEELTVATAAP